MKRLSLFATKIRAFLGTCLLFAVVLAAMSPAWARHIHGQPSEGLADATVLIIRHAEKPERGRELNDDGFERARRYVGFFRQFSVDHERFRADALYASADSRDSERPRLTITPLSQALRLPIDQRFSDSQTKGLAHALRNEAHGRQILICWHHGEIPKLLRDLGADPDPLLRGDHWPSHVFDWVVVLQYDHEGRLAQARVVPEDLMPGDR